MLRLHPGWNRGWGGWGGQKSLGAPSVRWRVPERGGRRALEGDGAPAGRGRGRGAGLRLEGALASGAAARLCSGRSPLAARGSSPEPRHQRAVGKRACGGRAGAAVGCVSPRPALLVVTRRALCAPALSAPGDPGAGAGLGAGWPSGFAAGGPVGGCARPRGEVGSRCLRRGGLFVLEING